jgi:hypothetical protein
MGTGSCSLGDDAARHQDNGPAWGLFPEAIRPWRQAGLATGLNRRRMGPQKGEIPMRGLLIAVAAFAGASAVGAMPALADTLQEVTTHGMVIMLGDMQIEVTYTPDGKYTAADGQVTGTWKIDGDKLCTTSNFDPNENCVPYPKGKKSGDSFEVTGPQGSATVKIK